MTVHAISIHALREEGDSRAACWSSFSLLFLSTPSARRATVPTWITASVTLLISIHALREEGDHKTPELTIQGIIFLSTPSARRATFIIDTARLVDDISIHALREEGDGCGLPPIQRRSYFYPRPPRGGRRSCCAPSARTSNFYPRPPRGGRHLLQVGDVLILEFLSTPSARRATPKSHLPPLLHWKFLSTPSARRATSNNHVLSIWFDNFYPRPPRGGRPTAHLRASSE